jgi:membrane protease YdiL (CAAX protease family)
MNEKVKNILAIFIGILPINLIMIWYRLTHTEAFTTFDMLVYPLVFGNGNILLILALNRYLLNKKISDFNSGQSNWYKDIFAGLILTAIYFLLLVFERFTLMRLLPQGQPPSQEIINMMSDLAHNPLLLLIWLGPVVWIGVALFEELVRMFFLKCLWRLSNNTHWEMFSIFLVSIIIAITHLYQGTFGIISIGIQGIIIGLYYYKYRRFLPLIISHALYDSIQIITFVLQVT